MRNERGESVQRMVVFPALSRPRTRIRASLFPNSDENSRVNTIPISTPKTVGEFPTPIRRRNAEHLDQIAEIAVPSNPSCKTKITSNLNPIPNINLSQLSKLGLQQPITHGSEEGLRREVDLRIWKDGGAELLNSREKS